MKKNKKQKYIDPNQLMSIECKKHPGYIQGRSYNDVMSGNGCAFCSAESTGNLDLTNVKAVCKDCGEEYPAILDFV